MVFKVHDMYYLETSSKQGENVERLFYEIAQGNEFNRM